MEAELIKARNFLFQQWAKYTQTMRLSMEVHSSFQVDLINQAKFMVEKKLNLQEMLYKAR